MKAALKIFADRILKPSSNDLFLPNEYTAPKGLDGLKVAKTIQPKDKTSFNEVYINTLNR